MKYIIDTHVFLWLLFEPQKIAIKKLKILENPLNAVYVSSLSFWEISLKYALGKLELNAFEPDDLVELAIEMDIRIVDIDARDMASYFKLGKVDKHRDPFDRLLIYYCINHDYCLVSDDDKFFQYKNLGLKLL